MPFPKGEGQLKKYIEVMRKILLALGVFFAATLSAQTGKCSYVGGDISLLPSYEASNTVYLDQNGSKIDDLIPWLIDKCGWNTFRVRLFVNPQKKNQKSEFDPAVCQDIEFVKVLGKRIKDAGGRFMLDFHYSDTWADPVSQKLPSAWSDCNTAEKKAAKVYSYTKESLEALKAAGACPDLVQVGNEISYGMVGIQVHPYDKSGDDWDGFVSVLKDGCKAVREVCPDAKIIIHTERSGNSTQTEYYYNKLKGVDYDIIGLSYYPFWHGPLSTFSVTLNNLASVFPDKKVQIVETAYYFQYWPSEGITFDSRSTWACSADGQYGYIKDLIAELKKHDNVDGLSYWCPEEAGNGDAANWTSMEGVVISAWINRGLWWSSNSNGHWPLTSGGNMTVSLLKDALSAEAAGISSVKTPVAEGCTFNIAGQRVDDSYKGVVIQNGRKFYRK